MYEYVCHPKRNYLEYIFNQKWQPSKNLLKAKVHSFIFVTPRALSSHIIITKLIIPLWDFATWSLIRVFFCSWHPSWWSVTFLLSPRQFAGVSKTKHWKYPLYIIQIASIQATTTLSMPPGRVDRLLPGYWCLLSRPCWARRWARERFRKVLSKHGSLYS